jgi:hypothetical protein
MIRLAAVRIIIVFHLCPSLIPGVEIHDCIDKKTFCSFHRTDSIMD